MWSPRWDASNIEKDGHLMMTIAIFFTISAMAVALFWFMWNWKSSKNPTPPLPPGPRGLPFLGSLPFLGPNLHHEFTNLASVYGPIYKLQLGSKLCFVLSSPSLVKQVVRDQDTLFANHDPTIAAHIASYGGTDIAFGSYGPDWRRLRKVFVIHVMSKGNLDACYALRKEEVLKSIGHIYGKSGRPIDCGQVAFFTAINTIMRMLWGGTLEAEKGTDLGAEFRNVVAELVELLGKGNISDFFPWLARFDVQGIARRAKQLLSVTENILNSAIDKQMSEAAEQDGGLSLKHERKGFLQFLLEFNEHGDDEESLTLQQIKALLTDIVAGGTDTTATIVEWVMAELMQHPDDLKKVQQELKEVVGLDNLVEESHLPKLHYLDVVIKETSRLHPAFPLLTRHCPSQSTTIGGFKIPKGSNVYLNVWAIHRDPNVWDNPLEFRPKRFLNDPPSNNIHYNGNKLEYLPFGSGRRMCPGIPLAERMMIYVLASFLHSFEWRLPNDAKLDLQDKFGIVTKKMNPLVVIPTPRLSKLELYT
ncbi:flavonoid 3-monooxygenase [Prunus yedoensis var. nudiflora]|uniref:Flavonoid 3-monooxygenase n=1 Tax=Prunus yedoensis var. nudiflora TaxID=2094558 RepID=A0A314UIM9_PRUYE|nr:flavonoid 3-monooxygenase [Prunus yedoensis var. nudiflora]